MHGGVVRAEPCTKHSLAFNTQVRLEALQESGLE